jgi:hypothetical protein
MGSAVRLKQLASALLPAIALFCALPVAVAAAHDSNHHGAFVEVRGVVTTAPSGDPGSFTATAYVVAPHFFHAGAGHGWGGGHGHHWGGGNWSGGSSQGSGSSTTNSSKSSGSGPSKGSGYSYTYSGKLRSHSRHDSRRSEAADGTPGTVIDSGDSTQVRIDGQQSSFGQLAVGDQFTAVYDGTSGQSLATIVSQPALWISAWSPTGSAGSSDSLYAFVGTVASTDTSAGTITVNVTSSIPNGLFSGTDTFDVGSQTIVLGNSDETPFGSLSGVTPGDVVAGGLRAPSGTSAATIESTPLEVLVDFPQSTSSSSSSASADRASTKRAEHRALKLLRREQAKHGHHKQK